VASRFFSERLVYPGRTVARRLLVLALVLAPAAGCASLRPPLVRPHERVHLADRIMRSGLETLSRSADEHVLSTREGAMGGTGTTGGGCGCN